MRTSPLSTVQPTPWQLQSTCSVGSPLSSGRRACNSEFGWASTLRSRSWTVLATSASGCIERHESAPRRTEARSSSRTRRPGIVEDLESGEFDLRDLGEFRLKDIARPQRLFELRVQGLEQEFAPPRGLDEESAYDPYGRVGTLLGTDLVAFTPTLRKLGDDVIADFAAGYRKLVQESVATCGGMTIEAVADNVIAVFESALDALTCAASTRSLLRGLTWPSGEESSTTFAVHTGRLVARNHAGTAFLHLVGLLHEAEPGQILVSHSTEAVLEGVRLEPLSLRDLGERRLPRFETPYRVFELVD
jgi:class 3 adenylate cyclase